MSKGCRLCPRWCGTDRVNNKGYCGAGDSLKVARAALHMWEEPCISGKCGSGTVFFSGCSLRCVYCQNGGISGGESGRQITVGRLSEIFLELQSGGAHNINLVTPDHYADKIAEALKLAADNGLCIPVVYNTSGYCSCETLRMLEGLVDIYLVDFKYADGFLAKRYSNAPDYPEVAVASIAEMLRQQPRNAFEGDLMTNGVIIRHLVLPNNVKNSKLVLRNIYDNFGDRIFISIMNQYVPCNDLRKFPEINRRVTNTEYDRVLGFAEKLGFENVYIQDGGADEKSFIPPFDNQGV